MRGTYGVRISRDFMQAAKDLAEEMGEEEAYRTFAQIEAQAQLYEASDSLFEAQSSWELLYGPLASWSCGGRPSPAALRSRIEQTWRVQEEAPQVMADMREALHEMLEAEGRLEGLQHHEQHHEQQHEQEQGEEKEDQ